MMIKDLSQPIRVGIVGSGFAASFHWQNFPRHAVVLAGVTSAREANREAFAAKHGTKAYLSVEAMLPHIDILATSGIFTNFCGRVAMLGDERDDRTQRPVDQTCGQDLILAGGIDINCCGRFSGWHMVTSDNRC